MAEVSSITPAISYGQTPITISGRAKDRLTNAAVGNATLKVILTVNGFKRQLNIVTDAAGNFAYPFVPQAADAGTYSVIMGKQGSGLLLSHLMFMLFLMFCKRSRGQVF